MAKDIKPMGVTEEKQNKVKELTELMKNSASVTFVDYAGLTVKAQQELKTKLASVGAKMLVAKNTLVRIAGKEAGFGEDDFSEEMFSGQTAMIVGNTDPVSPIQIVGKEMSQLEVLKFKAGIVEGVFTGAEGIIQISKLPGKEQLQMNVVGAIAGPLYGLVGTLQGNLQKLLCVLKEASGREAVN